MYISEYYVPSHITGLFVPFFSDDTLKAGSCGAGVSLSLGVRTKIKVVEGEGLTEIYMNGIKPKDYNNTLSLNCVNLIKDRYQKSFLNKNILIEHESDVPTESGFGTSASAALGICFSIKNLIDITTSECVKIAHEAEVKSLTGLGDVVAEVKGGIEIRKTPGVDGIIENIPSDDLEVLAISFGVKQTERVLKDPKIIQKIEKYGNKLLTKLISEPTVEMMMDCSNVFTHKTQIMSQKVLDLIEFISEVNSYNAAGIMIGEGVFTLINKKDKKKILDNLRDVKGKIIISPISLGLL